MKPKKEEIRVNSHWAGWI